MFRFATNICVNLVNLKTRQQQSCIRFTFTTDVRPMSRPTSPLSNARYTSRRFRHQRRYRPPRNVSKSSKHGRIAERTWSHGSSTTSWLAASTTPSTSSCTASPVDASAPHGRRQTGGRGGCPCALALAPQQPTTQNHRFLKCPLHLIVFYVTDL